MGLVDLPRLAFWAYQATRLLSVLVDCMFLTIPSLSVLLCYIAVLRRLGLKLPFLLDDEACWKLPTNLTNVSPEIFYIRKMFIS